MCKCQCNGNSPEVNRLSDIVGGLVNQLAPFLKGHPLMFLQEASDIAAFDVTTGEGSGTWAGWAAATGAAYTYGGNTVQTYDMRDNVPVGSGTTYTVGQTFGEATHTLVPGEIPVISIALTDPGHTHPIADPGHNHAVTDPGHTHAASQVSHLHNFSVDNTHHHNLPVAFNIVDGHTSGTAYNAVDPDPGTGGTLVTADTTITIAGTTDGQTPAITVESAFTGIGVDDNTTGITVTSNTTGITADDIGGGLPHNNLQPSCAGLWVQKIG
jgi:microcystin-dependent protein